jgi:hypothetical protein
LLDNAGDALQPHAGIDARFGQRGALAFYVLVELHKNQVPDFQPAAAVVVKQDAAIVPAAGAMFRPPIVVDFAGRAAGTDIAHHPEVVLSPIRKMRSGDRANFVTPDGLGLVVAGMDGVVEAVGVNLADFGQEIIGVANGFAFEVVAEGEVAQHLEEGVVARRRADVFQVVVFALYAHTFLGTVAAREYGRFSFPKKTSTNWFIPALVKSRVGLSNWGRGALATGSWPISVKKSKNACRISWLVVGFI